MLRPAMTAVMLVMVLAACDDGGGYMAGGPLAAGAVAGVASNMLTPSGQGNSGGVLAVQGSAPAAGVEASMSYNATGRGSGANVEFHNGPMEGVIITCAEAGGGAGARACDVSNADSAYLVNELSGVHSYTGAFAVNGYGTDGGQDGFTAIHASPDERGFVQLPGEAVGYTGQFQSGASLRTGGTQFAGRATGSVAMQADFAAGTISAQFNGSLRDDDTSLTTPLAAGFEGGVIDPNGRFYNSEETIFAYGGQQAWGELDGAFYGPNAEEAAGTFGFGNDLGGMSGVMIGCSDYNPANCVAPSPRF